MNDVGLAPDFALKYFFVKGTLSKAMADTAVRLGLLVLPALGWGWWTGGRTEVAPSSLLASTSLSFNPSAISGSGPADSGEEMRWGWWSVSLLVECAVGRVFSKRFHVGSAATGGGWASYLPDRSGLWMFGDCWPLVPGVRSVC